MEELFYKLVDKAYILPIDEEIKDSLQVSCDKYLTELNLQKFEDLSRCFIFGVTDKFLWTYIKQYISEYSLDIKLSKLLCKSLAQYIVVASFKDDSITDSTKADYSLSLMNMMVGARSKKVSIPYSDSLQEGIDYYINYFRKKAYIKKTSTTMLIPQILGADKFDDIEGVDMLECFEEIQFYCRQYARNQYSFSKNELKRELDTVQNAYEKAYCIAKMLSKQKWIFVDPNPIRSILEFELSNKTKKKLSEIKAVILQSRFYEPASNLCESSLVLNYVDEYGSDIDESIRFSPLEFAIALYYEFLFEYKNEA